MRETGDAFTLALDAHKLLVPTPGGKQAGAGVIASLVTSWLAARLLKN